VRPSVEGIDTGLPECLIKTPARTCPYKLKKKIKKIGEIFAGRDGPSLREGPPASNLPDAFEQDARENAGKKKERDVVTQKPNPSPTDPGHY